MKIRTKEMSYEQVMNLPGYVHKVPRKQSVFFRGLVKVLSEVLLLPVRFEYKEIGMEKLEKDQPCLILMNHSSFMDLEIMASIFYKRPYQIVCTLDSFVGKKWVLRLLGCIPTKKFIMEPVLIKDMIHCFKKLNSSVVMFPEAGYSFDGKAVTLPDSLGKCLKLLGVPVVMVRTKGAFHRQPLYNNLKLRKVKVSAEVEYLLTAEDVKTKSAKELNEILREQFSFDHFRWQQENQIRIGEKFRAEGLNRVLYKCPSCLAEGNMKGQGTRLICQDCGKEYELTEYGYMKAINGETEMDHIPDWNQWQRACVRKELEAGKYELNLPVDIYVMVDAKGLYKVGKGNLSHTAEGFHLNGCDGKLDYHQLPGASYTLNSDFYWYEIGDVIGIGTSNAQYYCFPQGQGDIVAKARLAAEELYKITEEQRKQKSDRKRTVE